jgi:putative pyoverdin transport system ATP-binding/permease protein
MKALFQFVGRNCRGMLILTATTALLSGACNAGLIALVNHLLTHPGRPAVVLGVAFALLGVGKVLTSYFSQVTLTKFSQRAVATLRNELVRKILAVPLRQLEEVGAPRLMVALTDDVSNITQAFLGIPIVGINLAILMGGAAYLGWLSWPVLLLMGVFCLIGAFGYRAFVNRAQRHLSLAREDEDQLFQHFRGLTEGIKELKLHRSRRGVFLSRCIEKVTASYSRRNVAAENLFAMAQSWSHLLFFAVIGLLLFLTPAFEQISKEALTGYIITILYLMGPLVGVLSSFSVFGRATISFQKIHELGMSLENRSAEICPVAGNEKPMQFNQLDLIRVTHSYHHEKEDSNFVLGPMSLSIRAGELVFLVGGNGSGKSTLAKMIAGLYPPESGEVRVNGRAVTDENRDDFRQIFSAVFADFYLFDSLLGLESTNVDQQAQEYLQQLHLSHKVKVRDGALSTTALSQGQRKRLALLTAYLEDRPFYLFDEWASDQDPLFKEIFYNRLLPDLQARGKTTLVITHDDKYFDVADRILKLDSGQLVSDTMLNPEGTPAAALA